ncbi:MAG: S8 family serine peptidase [Candidatus Moraniibacteriota bacterium]
MKKKKLVLIILGLSFLGGLFWGGDYCHGVKKGTVAVINSNFYLVDDSRINSEIQAILTGFHISTYNAYTQSSSDPVNEKLYSDPNPGLEEKYNSHGTIVAQSLMNEITTQLGDKKDLYPNILLIKTSPNDNWMGDANAIARGIRYAADQGADVINISMGIPDEALYKNEADINKIREYKNEIESALQYARNKGSTIVAASGNDDYGNNPVISHPASSKNTIAVGAHDATGHPTTYTQGVGDTRLDFTARTSLRYPDGSDAYGTSFAAPVVAADAYVLKKTGDPSRYDLDGDGQLSQDEIIEGLNQEAGKRFGSVSSINIDRAEFIKKNYGFLLNNSDGKVISAQLLGGPVYYDPKKEENYIEGYYLNSGRFNEFIDALDDIGFEEQEYCYKSHAFQLCGFESLALCESMMSQDVGGCGKIGDMVNTQDGLEGILAADIDGDGIPDGETDTNFWDNPLGGGDPNADSSDIDSANADGCATGFAMEGGICMPSSSLLGLHSPAGDNPLLEVLRKVMLWLLGVIGFIAIITFVISGIQYLISAGDQNMIETAKRNMKWSIVGVVTALSGLIILQFIYLIMS